MLKDLTACLVLAGVAQSAGAQASTPTSGQQITRTESVASYRGPTEFFSGNVQITPVFAANNDINASGGSVVFEPGARSAWHTHPKGQYLVVTSGRGLTQEWGKPVQEIAPGDVVWCPPGVKHWHGATPTSSLTHLAVTGTVDGKNVTWMEKVSDDQYLAR